MRGILVGWCLLGLVDFVSATTIRMASGYAPDRAWASLTGTIAVETANHSFVFWETPAGARWNLTLSGVGRMDAGGLAGPPLMGQYQIPGHDFLLTWEMLVPGSWYATASLQGGVVESATPVLEALGEDRWRAGLFITGLAAPEPGALVVFLISAALVNTRRRGRVFLLGLKQLSLICLGVIVTQVEVGLFGDNATARCSL